MIENDSDHGYLLHNKESVYENNAAIPIQPGTFVFCEKVMRLPAGASQSNNVDLFQGDHTERAFNRALSWLQKRQGITCKHAGGFVNEHNFRFYVRRENEFPDRMVHLFRDIYRNIFTS